MILRFEWGDINMKKKMIKPAVLTGVFLLALVIISILTNQVNEDLTTNMAKAKLPLLRFYSGETQINELHGYTKQMDITKMRDSITPINRDRRLPLQISTYGMDIDRISFEIRNMNADRLVADGAVERFALKHNMIDTELEIPNILSQNEEYCMQILLETEETDIFFYTRLIQTEEYHVEECLDFVLKFHDYSFREDAADFIPTYMDPATGDTSTLNYVDLTCTLKQITWADFKGEKLTEPSITIKEINDSYNVIILDYVLTSLNDLEETEYYNIEEYYRLRKTDDRMYVLNFERTMNQIFRGENSFSADSSNFVLGIRDKNVAYKASEAGDIISFVQAGELWCYHMIDNTLVQVFSFLDPEGVDVRENWNEHDIDIIRMDEAGSIDFVVCGYMNRGEHEGEVGLSVYHYDGLAHTIEEELFLPSTKSFDILKAELGQLMYVNENETLFLMLEGTVYEINLDQLKAEPLVSGLADGSYAVSKSNRYFAWVDSDTAYASATIHLMDFRTGKVTDISDGENLYLRPLGYLEEDFIYGAAESSLVSKNAVGKIDFPMQYIKIMDLDEKGYSELKQYKKRGRYIEDIEVEDATIQITLLKNSDGQFISAGTDSIVNREVDKQGRVTIGNMVTEEKETQITLTQTAQIPDKNPKMIIPKSVILEKEPTLEIPLNDEKEHFYVYAKGRGVMASESISESIRCANEQMGVVINEQQEYVWLRARKNTQSPIAGIEVAASDQNANGITKCVSAMLGYNGLQISVSDQIQAGKTPKEILEENLKEHIVLDLTGCTAEEVVFYVSRGNPVFAMTGNEDAVLITGFDSQKIYCFHPDTKQTEGIEYEEANKIFQKAGAIFFSYL